MEMIQMFRLIEDYHKTLGYNLRTKDGIHIDGLRLAGLALFQEVAELIDSFPWKQWRKSTNQRLNIENARIEIIDCFFFLGLIMEAANITPEELEIIFNSKLRENYDRIKRGYNNKPEERG